jgi:hypothetical protein
MKPTTRAGPKTLDPRPAPEAAAPVLYASAGDLKKLSLPNFAKPIPISDAAHPYGTNRAYPIAKNGPSRSRSRADHECAPRRRGALQTETASQQGNGSKRPLAGRASAAQTAHPPRLTGRAHPRRGGRNTRHPQAAGAGDPGVAIRAHPNLGDVRNDGFRRGASLWSWRRRDRAHSPQSLTPFWPASSALRGPRHFRAPAFSNVGDHLRQSRAASPAPRPARRRVSRGGRRLTGTRAGPASPSAAALKKMPRRLDAE